MSHEYLAVKYKLKGVKFYKPVYLADFDLRRDATVAFGLKVCWWRSQTKSFFNLIFEKCIFSGWKLLRKYVAEKEYGHFFEGDDNKICAMTTKLMFFSFVEVNRWEYWNEQANSSWSFKIGYIDRIYHWIFRINNLYVSNPQMW